MNVQMKGDVNVEVCRDSLLYLLCDYYYKTNSDRNQCDVLKCCMDVLKKRGVIKNTNSKYALTILDYISKTTKRGHIISQNINTNINASSLDKPSTLNHESTIKNVTILNQIGEGGYGEIYKIKNNVDNKIYALKKTIISNNRSTQHLELTNFSHDNIQDKIQINNNFQRQWNTELNILTNVQHENIIRYYDSWFDFNKFDNITQKYSIKSQSANNSANDSANKLIDSDTFNSCDLSIIDKCSENFNSTKYKSQKEKDIIQVCLYTQMEYCDYNLKDVIENNNINEHNLDKSFKRIHNLFSQILMGVNYLHKNNLVHRDLKPSNILIQLDKFAISGKKEIIKIIDFGCSIISPDNFDNLDNFNNINDIKFFSSSQGGSYYNDDTKCIGTQNYVPLDKNKNSKKIDIYSLGIILFELACNIKTQMEKLRILQVLKYNNVNNYLSYCDHIKKEKIFNLISSCIHSDPNKRPTIGKLMYVWNNIS